MTIESIRKLKEEGKTKWANHCVEKMGERDISVADVKSCIESGEIIEEYPNDYPNPSCLICGKDDNGEVIHLVVGSDGEILYLITAYHPNTLKFEADLKTRRK